ncbi:MAG: class B sortase [Bacillus sp. (in: firmicutes)]
MNGLKRFFSKAVFLVLIVLLCWSGYCLIDYLAGEYKIRGMEEQFDDKKAALAKSDYDFSSLLETNPDTVGWISINGTEVDYPVVQTTDNDYYLTHNFNREEAKEGCIFMDYRNESMSLGPHTILYGHHMRNGSMFHDLKKYENQDFLENHSYIEYRSVDGILYRWQVFSSYITDLSFNYLQLDFASDEDYLSFLQTIRDKSQVTVDIDLSTEDQILTLSTCTYEVEDGRRVVHAKLVEEAK